MDRKWLLDNAQAPIRYNLNHDVNDIELLLQNSEVFAWLSRLAERQQADNVGAIHGSHDYRMENILGKCWILGLSKSISSFAENMAFITRFLDNHIQTPPSDELSFGKLYHFRDYEKVLCCFLPFLGFRDDPAVLHITKKRIEVLYNFTKQKRYDIYVDGSKLKGVKKEWQPYIINPDLYADGHIALPDMHDFLLFAEMFSSFGAEEKQKAETIVSWLFDDGFNSFCRRYGYFYAPGGSYSTKAIILKPQLLDFHNMAFDNGDLASLLFTVFVLSHFQSARNSDWFLMAESYLDQYKNEAGRYVFPPHLIVEKPDSYVISGGHMNVGENKRNKAYSEIISTYWMNRIKQNTGDLPKKGK